MSRFILAVSAAHLVLLPAYVKLGAINPWQAVGSLFGSGSLWALMMLSAAAAPFVLGSIAWGIDSFILKLSFPIVRKVRESAFVILAIVSLLGLLNAVLLADRTVEQNFRVSIVVFISGHLLAVATITIIIIVTLLAVLLGLTAVREGFIRILRPTLYILAPSVLFSVIGVFYLLSVATPAERSEELFSENSHPSIAKELPSNVVVLLFDGFSYGVAFQGGEVAENLPNLRSLVDSSLVFHNAQSYSSYTIDNVPPLLTGRIYDAIKLDSQGREVAKLENGISVVLQDERNIFDLAREQDYRVTVFGYFLRYCSTYVQGVGYCQSSSADEFNPQPSNLIQALFEVYRLAAAKSLPTSMGYRLERLVGTTFLSLVEDRVLGLHDSLLPLLEDPKGRFIYAHYPVPHSPYLRINSETRELSSAGASYVDGLQVVDFFLGEIRRSLEKSSSWDDMMLIMLSDHNDAAATSDIRFPLIIKLPNMNQRVDFDGFWTHAQFLPLLEELFQGRSLNPEAVKAIAEELSPPQDSTEIGR